MTNDKIILNDLKTIKTHTSIHKEDAKKLKDYLYKLERLIADENYLELEYAAECFTCAVREIAAKTITVSKTKSLLPSTGSMGIAVQKNDDILKVTLPMILPTKSKAKAEYLFEPLFFAMKEFSRAESVFIDEKAIMCIEYVYDKDGNIPRGDHDNKEVKQIIDAISAFVVSDDSDNYLSLYQCTADGEDNHTNVYVKLLYINPICFLYSVSVTPAFFLKKREK